jgi:hypothetical protein
MAPKLSRFANHIQDDRTCGGRLVVTDEALRFQPHLLDRMFRGLTVELPLAAISQIEVVAHDDGIFDGSVQDHLCVMLSDGSSEFFLVNRVDEFAEQLRARLPSRR